MYGAFFLWFFFTLIFKEKERRFLIQLFFKVQIRRIMTIMTPGETGG